MLSIVPMSVSRSLTIDVAFIIDFRAASSLRESGDRRMAPGRSLDMVCRRRAFTLRSWMTSAEGLLGRPFENSSSLFEARLYIVANDAELINGRAIEEADRNSDKKETVWRNRGRCLNTKEHVTIESIGHVISLGAS